MNNSRWRFIWMVLLLGCLLMANPGVASAPLGQEDDGNPQTEGVNLLRNGGFEEEDPGTHGFKWFPPNHFLALHWYRWWVNSWPAQPQIPEYDDMRPTSKRWPPLEGNHAQVYFKWGPNYLAGVYQVVEELTPCVPYEFSMYVNSQGNPGTVAHARIGLDPEGTQITLDHTHNDLIGGQMPPYTAWSEEQLNIYLWEQLVVTAEPLGSRLTAITYANPIYEGTLTPWYDTWWDAGVLRQVPFPDNRLPEPTSWNAPFANINTAINGDNLSVTWNTTFPASTQVWYGITPVYITPTHTMTHTIFLPLISNATSLRATPLDTTPTTYHAVNIAGMQALKPGDQITLWLLSRRPTTGSCITEGYGPVVVTITE